LLSFAAPAFLRHGPLPACDLERICRGLRLSPQDIVASNWIDNGPGWRGIVLKSDTQLRSLSVDAGSVHAVVFARKPVGRFCEQGRQLLSGLWTWASLPPAPTMINLHLK
jgi:predicted PhzF superfamily epimerase YddE/YHI9